MRMEKIHAATNFNGGETSFLRFFSSNFSSLISFQDPLKDECVLPVAKLISFDFLPENF